MPFIRCLVTEIFPLIYQLKPLREKKKNLKNLEKGLCEAVSPNLIRKYLF